MTHSNAWPIVPIHTAFNPHINNGLHPKLSQNTNAISSVKKYSIVIFTLLVFLVHLLSIMPHFSISKWTKYNQMLLEHSVGIVLHISWLHWDVYHVIWVFICDRMQGGNSPGEWTTLQFNTNSKDYNYESGNEDKYTREIIYRISYIIIASIAFTLTGITALQGSALITIDNKGIDKVAVVAGRALLYSMLFLTVHFAYQKLFNGDGNEEKVRTKAGVLLCWLIVCAVAVQLECFVQLQIRATGLEKYKNPINQQNPINSSILIDPHMRSISEVQASLIQSLIFLSPASIQKYSPLQLHSILLHEQSHIKHKDAKIATLLKTVSLAAPPFIMSGLLVNHGMVAFCAAEFVAAGAVSVAEWTWNFLVGHEIELRADGDVVRAGYGNHLVSVLESIDYHHQNHIYVSGRQKESSFKINPRFENMFRKFYCSHPSPRERILNIKDIKP